MNIDKININLIIKLIFFIIVIINETFLKRLALINILRFIFMIIFELIFIIIIDLIINNLIFMICLISNDLIIINTL